MKLSPDLIKKQKKLGVVMKDVVGLASRTAAISNEVTDLLKGENPVPKPDPRKLVVNTFKKVGLDTRSPEERKQDENLVIVTNQWHLGLMRILEHQVVVSVVN